LTVHVGRERYERSKDGLKDYRNGSEL